MKTLEREKIILLVQLIVVLVFVLSIVLAVNFKKTFRQTRNVVREQHMEAIVNAVYTYYAINHKFPDCIPKSGKTIDVTRCKEIEPFLTYFPKDPSPHQKYLIEYFNKKRGAIKVFSSSPEAKGIEIIR